MTKVYVLASYKSGKSYGKELEFMSDDFDDYISRLYDKLENGQVRLIIISTVEGEKASKR
jgi:hypothetical protein